MNGPDVGVLLIRYLNLPPAIIHSLPMMNFAYRVLDGPIGITMKLFRADPPSRPPGPYPSCLCFDTSGSRHAPRVPRLHDDAQDTGAAGWLRVLERIDSAIRSGAEELAPLEGLSGPERAAVVTLPPTIRQLDRVRRLRLYSSHLVRLPPEIGEMHSLEYLDVYTSYRLHYFPYEITRCPGLRTSRVSTRALYGNHKYRAPFPDLTHSANVDTAGRRVLLSCSVCGSPLGSSGITLRWITLAVGTDYMPLLVCACSTSCVEALPPAPTGYVQCAHSGGASILQPPPEPSQRAPRTVVAGRRPTTR